MNLLQQDGHRWIGEGLIITILCAFWVSNLSITIFFANVGWSCAFHSILQNIYPGTGSYVLWRKGDQCSLSSLQPTYYFSIEKDFQVLSTLKQLLRLVWIMWKNVEFIIEKCLKKQLTADLAFFLGYNLLLIFTWAKESVPWRAECLSFRFSSSSSIFLHRISTTLPKRREKVHWISLKVQAPDICMIYVFWTTLSMFLFS